MTQYKQFQTNIYSTWSQNTAVFLDVIYNLISDLTLQWTVLL